MSAEDRKDYCVELGMSMERYLADPAVDQSSLKRAWGRTWAEFDWHKRNPSKPSPAMNFGTAWHILQFEPQRWIHAVAVAPTVDGRTKEGKAEKAAFLARSAGRIVISEEEDAALHEMQAALIKHEEALKLCATDGRCELSLFWTDDDTGIECKARIDKYSFDGTIIDGKTARDVSPQWFSRSAYQLGYHLQAAFYIDAVEACRLGSFARFRIVAQCSAPPYLPAVYQFDDDQINLGRATYKRLLGELATCRAKGRFPGYDGVTQIHFAPWAFTAEYGDDETPRIEGELVGDDSETEEAGI